MNKQQATEKINNFFNAEPALLEACIKILNYLSSKDKRNLLFISIDRLSDVSGLKEKTEIMQVCNYLVSDECPVLIEKFDFIDGDNAIDIPIEEINEARKEGVFYHPEKGVPVDNFEAAICSYFSINPNFECSKGKPTMENNTKKAKKTEKPVVVFMHGKIYETTAKIARVFGEKRAQVVIEGETLEFKELPNKDSHHITKINFIFEQDGVADGFYLEGNISIVASALQTTLEIAEKQCEEYRLQYEKLQNSTMTLSEYNRLLSGYNHLLQETQQAETQEENNEL